MGSVGERPHPTHIPPLPNRNRMEQQQQQRKKKSGCKKVRESTFYYEYEEKGREG